MTATSASRCTSGGPTSLPTPTDGAAAKATYGSVGTVPSAPGAMMVSPAPVRARVIAGLIDLAGGAVVCGMLGALLNRLSGLNWIGALALAILIVLAVREVVLGRTGWSPGGRLMGVQLISERTGLPPGPALLLHADLTFICVVPTLGIGAIVLMRTAATDPQGRGWHDRLTGVKLVQLHTRQGADSPASAAAARSTAAGRRGPFSDGRFSFAPSGSPIAEADDTVDSSRAAFSNPNTRSVIIDSVPWSAVPTPLDSTTNDAPAAPLGEAVDSGVVRSTRTAVPSRRDPQPPAQSQDASATAAEPRRRTRAQHRKSEPDTVGIRLVPTDGGAPILLTTPTVVGRDPENISEYPDAARVPLTDVSRSISKTHAAIAPVPGGLWVTDLHSTNGTRIEQQGVVKEAQPEVPAPAPIGSMLLLGRAAYQIEG
ncbi:RDD family protein [Actinomyces procaprae]|uniref:RDD family protein n=1 Tax=Actinomyces procaprae TaxID=2560010 RepID=UPI00109DA58B|nr:RDD family protein [Actinomyces procaprae]